MSYFILEDFRLGQDSRKTPVTAPPGTLTTLINGHITRGGDLEVRKAFVPTYTLPTGTFGLAVSAGSLYVFGSDPAPVMPAGVLYQRLEHPTGEDMVRVANSTIFAGKLYVIAEYADGSIQHFYDGTIVATFTDGKARGSFAVTGGTTSNQQATGSFTITGGTQNFGTNQVTSVVLNGVDVLGSPVDWTTSNANTAALVAAQITAYTSVPNYTAVAVGTTITITASVAGSAPNGFAITPTVAGDVTTGASAAMSGGTDVNAVTSVRVNGVEVLGAAVAWTTSNSNTAALVAAQINAYVSSPEYDALANDARVIVAAGAAGMSTNGYVVAVTTSGTLTVGDIANMDKGLDNPITPGEGLATFGTKEYVTSGSRLVFSAIGNPTDYNDETGIGAGSTDMTIYSSESEQLTALKPFYDKMAIFASNAVQIWYLDADDANNANAQTIEGTGTDSTRSVQPFGDGDLFYLASNGIRALRARDTTNVGTVAEVGSAIDPAVIDYLATLTDEQKARATAVIEPLDKRYWLAVGDKIYVYSFFSGAKIAAWSTYELGFAVSDFAVLKKRVYARSGDTVYLYGGDDNTTYDADTVCEVLVPYNDARTPGNFKTLNGVDVVGVGTWFVQMASNPSQPDAFDDLGSFTDSTLHKENNFANGQSPYFAFKFTHQGAEPARLSRFVMYFEKDDDHKAAAA